MNDFKEELEWFPLYVLRFMAGTTNFEPYEVGGYFRLLIHEWRKGSVPFDDEDEIRKLTGIKRSSLSKIKSKFCKTTHGWQNDTLEEVRIEQHEKQAKRTESARKAGHASAQKRTNVERTLNERQPIEENRIEENRIDINNFNEATEEKGQGVSTGPTKKNTTAEKVQAGVQGSSTKSVQPTIFRTYAEYTALGVVLNNQVSWKENVQRKYKLTVEEVNKWIGAWLDHIKTLAETTYYLQDAQSFCANWIGKKLQAKTGGETSSTLSYSLNKNNTPRT